MSMKRLPNKFSKILNEVKQNINFKYEHFDEINRIHSTISNIILQNGGTIEDLDELLLEYHTKSKYVKTIEALRKLTASRNKIIENKIRESSKLKKLVGGIHKKLKDKYSKEIINNAFEKILEIEKCKWNYCTWFVNIDGGSIRRMDISSIDDFKKIYKLII